MSTVSHAQSESSLWHARLRHAPSHVPSPRSASVQPAAHVSVQSPSSHRHAALRHAMSHVPSPRRERAHSNAQSPPGSGVADADVHANVKPVRVIE